MSVLAENFPPNRAYSTLRFGSKTTDLTLQGSSCTQLLICMQFRFSSESFCQLHDFLFFFLDGPDFVDGKDKAEERFGNLDSRPWLKRNNMLCRREEEMLQVLLICYLYGMKNCFRTSLTYDHRYLIFFSLTCGHFILSLVTRFFLLCPLCGYFIIPDKFIVVLVRVSR